MNYITIENQPASKCSINRRNAVCDIFINDAPFNASLVVDGARIWHEGYQNWVHMIHRSYGKVKNHFPTYGGVEICDEWRSFMAFRKWWIEAYVAGWCLDKDILGNGKLYSPDTCLYIPQWLNKFMNISEASRGKHPIGTSKSGNGFIAHVKNPITGKHEYLGYFKTDLDGSAAWRARKLEITGLLKRDMDAIDSRIYARVRDFISQAS